MQASVIIPTYGRPAFLSDALASVLAQDFPSTEYEIIVVDNAPQPTPDLETLCDPSIQPPVTYIHEQCNGLHNARHAGGRAASGGILVYIDDDVICPRGWLSAMVSSFAVDSNITMVAGRVNLQYESDAPVWLSQYEPFLSRLDMGDKPMLANQFLSPVGCNMAVLKSVLFSVGGFNPDSFGDNKNQYFRGNGENGLAKKVWNAGYKIYYNPHAWLFHRVPQYRMTHGYLQRRIFKSGIEGNYTYFRYQQPSLGRLVLRCAFLLAKYIRHSFRYNFARLSSYSLISLKISLQLEYNRGQLLHTIRLLLQPALRRHCLKGNYLDF